MVGHCPLEASIGVRVPDPQQAVQNFSVRRILTTVARAGQGLERRRREAAAFRSGVAESGSRTL